MDKILRKRLWQCQYHLALRKAKTKARNIAEFEPITTTEDEEIITNFATRICETRSIALFNTPPEHQNAFSADIVEYGTRNVYPHSRTCKADFLSQSRCIP